jgi:hypothetical protein
MTGRGLGLCGGLQTSEPGQPDVGCRRGFGRRRGGAGGGQGGRGWRHMFRATGLPGWARSGMLGGIFLTEQQQLEARAKVLENELKAVRARIDDVSNRDAGSPSGGQK